SYLYPLSLHDALPISFIEPAVKIYIYGITEQEDKQIETYEKHQKLFEELAIKIKEDPEKYHWDGKDALRILAPVINTYYYKKDRSEEHTSELQSRENL